MVQRGFTQLFVLLRNQTLLFLLQVTVNATDVFERYMYDSSYDDVIDHALPTLEVTEVSIGQTIEVPLTNTNKVVLSGTY